MECLLIGLSENNTVILTMDHSGRMSCSLYVKNLSVVPVLPDLPLCLGVLKHRAPLARGGAYSCQKKFYDGFLLMWCNFKFESVLLWSDSRHNDRVDSLWECATKQAVMRVVQ